MTGNQLKEWRQCNGMTQGDLADRLDVSRATIANNESQPEISERLEKQLAGLRFENGIKKIREGLDEILPLTKGTI